MNAKWFKDRLDELAPGRFRRVMGPIRSAYHDGFEVRTRGRGHYGRAYYLLELAYPEDAEGPDAIAVALAREGERAIASLLARDNANMLRNRRKALRKKRRR